MPHLDLLRVDAAELPEDPAEILAEWLPPNDDPERPVMTLATTAADGAPDARQVLLSEWDPSGVWFHTEGRSRKVAELAERPAAALLLTWPERRRQLVVRGIAERAEPEEEARAYRARTAYLRLLAWLGDDEFARLPYRDRVAAWAAFAAEHPDGLEPPPTWLGFAVRPTRLTFWVGSEVTASRRAEYARPTPADPWTARILAG